MTQVTSCVYVGRDFVVDLNSVVAIDNKFVSEIESSIMVALLSGGSKIVIRNRDNADEFQEKMIEFWNTKYGVD